MRREGEEEKWYFQDVKKDVKSSPFLCHWQFFLKAKTKSQHSEYTASIQLLLNDTGLYFLPYCYLANTLIAYIFNGASSDFTLGIWCMTNSIYGTSARNNDKSCYEYPRIHKCTAVTSGRKLHILGKKKKSLPTNFYKWIRSWIFSKGKDVMFGCWREKDLGCALFGGAKNKKSSHRKGFVRQFCLRANRQIGKQGISKLVTGDTHQNSV